MQSVSELANYDRALKQVWSNENTHSIFFIMSVSIKHMSLGLLIFVILSDAVSLY